MISMANHISVGRLLRMLENSKQHHVEVAKEELSRSTSVLTERLDDDRKNEDKDEGSGGNSCASLDSLSDHKSLSNLRVVMATISSAIQASQSSKEMNNVVIAFVNALISQAIDDCKPKKTVLAQWGKRAKRNFTLLDWTAITCSQYQQEDIVFRLLLQRMNTTEEKKKQMSACLVLYELLQYRRHFIIRTTKESIEAIQQRRQDVLSFVRPLCRLVNADTVDSRPTRLASVAQEALIMSCSFLSILWWHTHFPPDELHSLAKGMECALAAMVTWHQKSQRKAFLVMAAQLLQSYIQQYDVLQQSDSSDLLEAAAERMIWHWSASAMLFTSQSDVMAKVRSNRSAHLKSLLGRWNAAGQDVEKQPLDVLIAEIRQFCLIAQTTSSAQGEMDDVLSSPNRQMCLLMTLVIALRKSKEFGDRESNDFLIRILRHVFLRENSPLQREDAQRLVHCIVNIIAIPRQSTTTPPDRKETLGWFLSELLLQWELHLPSSFKQLLASRTHISVIMEALQVIRHSLLAISHEEEPGKARMWTLEFTSYVFLLLQHPDLYIRQKALALVPYLAHEECIRYLVKIDDTTSTAVLAWLFRTVNDDRLPSLLTFFLDTCHHGPMSSLQSYASSPGKIVAPTPCDIEELQAHQGRMIRISTGWIHTLPASRRSTVMQILLRKLFASSQEQYLFKLLQTMTERGWLEHTFSTIVSETVSWMKFQPRLTDDLLDDSSDASVDAIQALLFSRLAPVLVFRIVPSCFFRNETEAPYYCSIEDLEHVENYVSRVQEPGMTSRMSTLFHLLLRSILDPMEFKEVKQISVEILSKLSPAQVVPALSSHLCALNRSLSSTPSSAMPEIKALLHGIQIPAECDIMTGKLIVYCFNLFVSNEEALEREEELVLNTTWVMPLLLSLPTPSNYPNSMRPHIIDLRTGCVECLSILLLQFIEKGSEAMAKALLHVWVAWICHGAAALENAHEDRLAGIMQSRLENSGLKLATLELRISCCYVLQRTIARLDASTHSSSLLSPALSKLFKVLESDTDKLLVQSCAEVVQAFTTKFPTNSNSQ